VTTFNLALGIACILSGTAINSIGLILQKWEVNKSGMADDSNIAIFLKRPLWILGILMQTILFAPFFFIGIDLIGIVLAQPLAAAGLLVLVAGAVIGLKEKLSRIEWVGVSLTIVAILLVSIAGVFGDVTISAFFQGTFLASAIAVVLALATLLLAGGLLARLSKRWEVQGLAMLVGTSYSAVSISGQLVTVGFDAVSLPGNEVLGWVLGIAGLAGVVLGTIFGIIFSQRAFKKAQAIHIIPVSSSINNILPIIAGIVLFRQNITFPWLFIPGTILLLVAITLLARFQR